MARVKHFYFPQGMTWNKQGWRSAVGTVPTVDANNFLKLTPSGNVTSQFVSIESLVDCKSTFEWYGALPATSLSTSFIGAGFTYGYTQNFGFGNEWNISTKTHCRYTSLAGAPITIDISPRYTGVHLWKIVRNNHYIAWYIDGVKVASAYNSNNQKYYLGASCYDNGTTVSCLYIKIYSTRMSLFKRIKIALLSALGNFFLFFN